MAGIFARLFTSIAVANFWTTDKKERKKKMANNLSEKVNKRDYTITTLKNSSCPENKAATDRRRNPEMNDVSFTPGSDPGFFYFIFSCAVEFYR